jgi:UDP:flavonoid glycosyltransferase YjiC (YdhE family)
LRVLFIPHPLGGISHLIPLINLYRQLKGKVESAFFLAEPTKQQQGKLLTAAFGLNILRTNHNYTISSELAAYSEFDPSIVVDDTNLVTAYARQIRPLPRVTILRTGSFPNIAPKNRHHTHSMGHTVDQMPSVAPYGFETYRDFRDFLQAETRIIPGIRSVEVVDDSLKNDPRCFFSGPLILDDIDFVARQSLELFFRRNGARKRVYLTYGATQWRDTPSEVVEGIRYMLERGIAVVSNVDAGRASLLAEFPNTYFSAQYLPMHYVCANVDLVFHHCGSGAYHYPLLHGVFSVTLGTQKYDREDVALKLEQLGIARYIPGPLENQEFLQAFRACVDQYVIHDAYDRAMVRTKLGRLQEEIARTQKEFNFMQVLESARSSVPHASH